MKITTIIPPLALSLFTMGCHGAGDDSPLPRQEDTFTVGCPGCVVLQGGMVFDGTRSGRGVVVIEGERVKEVVFGEPRISAGEVVDARGKTVTPGLVDLHVHLMSESGPLGDFSQRPHPQEHLKAMLRAGVTSYLDLGSPQHVIFEVRSRTRAGAMLGPRTFAAGPLLTPTGGHPCYAGSPPGDFCTFVDSPAAVGKAFFDLVPRRPDVVKIVVEGGQSKPLPRMTRDTIAAIQHAAEPESLKVIAHVASSTDLTDALDGGVRLFAHIPSEDRVSPELAARMAASGVVVVPTLAVMDGFYRVSHGDVGDLEAPALKDDVPAEVLAALQSPAKRASMSTPAYKAMTEAWRENAAANFATLRAAGVVMATGTDAGNPAVFHGLAMQRELALYVEAGMSPEEALAAATRLAADVLGRSDLGRLAPGALADVLVVDGDAIADIAAMGRVERVYRDGALVDRAALALPNEAPLQLTPKVGSAGDTCLQASECGAGLACDDNLVCSLSCHGFGGCAPGSACLPLSGSSKLGACTYGDGCDPIRQDCVNGAACVPVGNGATTCWYAGKPTAGQVCEAGGLCAVGAACNFATNRCKTLCDPDGVAGEACPLGKQCVDYSAAAGLSVGQCE